MSAAANWALPYVFPTVVHMLADAAARAPDATALACGDRHLSYAQYLRCVAGFARELGRHAGPRRPHRAGVRQLPRHAGRHVRRPCRRCAGGADQSRLHRAGTRPAAGGRRPGRDRVRRRRRRNDRAADRVARAFPMRCGSAATEGRTLDRWKDDAEPELAAAAACSRPISPPCNIPAAPPGAPRASTSPMARWR